MYSFLSICFSHTLSPFHIMATDFSRTQDRIWRRAAVSQLRQQCVGVPLRRGDNPNCMKLRKSLWMIIAFPLDSSLRQKLGGEEVGPIIVANHWLWSYKDLNGFSIICASPLKWWLLPYEGIFSCVFATCMVLLCHEDTANTIRNNNKWETFCQSWHSYIIKRRKLFVLNIKKKYIWWFLKGPARTIYTMSPPTHEIF